MIQVDDVDIEQNLNLDLLKQDNNCNLCYLNQNKIIVCQKCKYKMCDTCYQLYINKYKYTNCPHCRETIIKDIMKDQPDSDFSIIKLLFKLLLMIVLILLSIFMGTFVTKDKKFNYINLNLLIGFLFLSGICICFFRHF